MIEYSEQNKDDSSSSEIEFEDDSSSSEIKDPFDPTKIDITVKPLIIDSLIKRMKSKPMRIDLNTEFQRLGNLWKEDAQSRLIESLLVKIPLPAFYFDGTDDNHWKIVDGLQRITTLKNFIIDKTLKLTNLEYLKQYDKKGFDDLPTFLQGRIEENQITAYIINPGTPPEVKFNIFKRINTGGLVLTPQEIRHALNQGIPANFIKELAEIDEFHQATDNVLNYSKRMEDRDFATRFIGFYYGYDEYKSDLDSHLNKAMSNLNLFSVEERNKIKRDFIKAMKASYEIFGNDAFRKRYNLTEKRKPINKALFDTWSVNLAKLSEEDITLLILKKDKLKEMFLNLMNTDKDFEKSITSATGDIRAVERRFSKIANLLKEVSVC
ncbi:MAG: hypothetical protein BWK80_56245 [Desulfobacteraceae bacterium IS3]|nr:MAG: hypothetical protein BWK80_56245 [Desulfobacteraceae bacterium IS3]HAO22386.1 DUF262 domain-containing protein [Desulfobacteraceae bacterium]